jgi:dTDP-4-amino-4,6-dideoxygalactose transaminase
VSDTPFIPYSPPCLGEEEIAEVVDTLRSAWITTGPKTKRFEEQFAAALGAPGALALNSCTGALHIALLAHGIGPGDEVIVPTMTFCATANVVEHVGARPVIVDVEPDTLNMDPAAVAAAITPHTRAVIPVHFAGHPVELDSLTALAAQHGLHVIEDAAHAVDSWYKGRRIGSGENLVAFSFYATKNLVTAEGGMLTGAPDLLEEARRWSLHGMNRDAWNRYGAGGNWYYEVTLPGFKYNMTDIQAALGLHQLVRLPAIQERRHAIAARYTAAFSACDALEAPVERPDTRSSWQLYVLRLRPEKLTIGRDAFLKALTERGIGTSVHFIPLHLHPFYREKYHYGPVGFPVAQEAFTRLFSLPLNLVLTDDDVDRVIATVLDLVEKHRR